MPTIAIDATYAIDPNPSGVAVYSRRLIESLAELNSPYRFLLCYRLSRWRKRNQFLKLEGAAGAGPRFENRYVQAGLTLWLPRQARLFHSLAQRPPAHRFAREGATIFDLFPIPSRDYSTPEFQKKFAKLLRQAAERSDRVITLSRATADLLVRHCGTPPERIRVIPGGVDLPRRVLSEAERQAVRERLGGLGRYLALCVGAIQTRKNTLNAVRALAQLPASYKLVLAGSEGPGGESVIEFIRREKLDSRVIRLGDVSTAWLPTLYQAANVLLFPSLEEGFGLPVLEAMAAGTPVVTSQTSCLPEVGGDAALYADPFDTTDIADKVRRAVEDDMLRQEMIRRGLERARQFTWRRAAEETLKVYRELVGAPGVN